MIEFIRELITSHYSQYLRTYVIYLVIIIASRVFLALAVYYHAKINHVKHGNLWTSAAFFCSLTVVAIYFWFNKYFKHEVPIVCTKCGRKPPRGRTKCPHCGGTHFAPAQYENIGGIKSRIIAFLAVGIALVAAGYWFWNYSPMAIPDDVDIADSEEYNEDFVHYDYDGRYYDMNGEEYIDNYEVPYYDKDGNEYIYDAIEGLVRNDGSGEAVPFDMALVGSDGCLSVGQFETVPEVVPFMTQDGTMYYWAKDVSWDKDGNLIYSSNGERVNLKLKVTATLPLLFYIFVNLFALVYTVLLNNCQSFVKVHKDIAHTLTIC